jgi:hypothetical protein
MFPTWTLRRRLLLELMQSLFNEQTMRWTLFVGQEPG